MSVTLTPQTIALAIAIADGHPNPPFYAAMVAALHDGLPLPVITDYPPPPDQPTQELA